MDGLRLQPGSLRHTLGRTSGRRCAKDLQPECFIYRYDPVRGRRLAGTGTAGQHHHLRHCRTLDSIRLDLVIFHAGLFLHRSDIHGQVGISALLSGLRQFGIELVAGGRCCQLLKLCSHANLCIIKRRQVDRIHLLTVLIPFHQITLRDQLILLQHIVHGRRHSTFTGFQKFHRRIDQLPLLCIDMPVI